jgi:hypothetical protein
MDFRDRMWRTADGRSIRIGDMELGHLVNVINCIADNKNSYTDGTYLQMIEEAKYRQTILFAEGNSYPQLVNNRWMIIDPATGQGKIIPPPADYIEAVKDNIGYQKMFQRTRNLREQN